MNLGEFGAANATIETNPVKRLEDRFDQICRRILTDDIPPAVGTSILYPLLEPLHLRAKEAIENGKFHLIGPILDQFASDLSRALDFERTFGALKPWRAADEIKRIAGRGLWDKFKWNGHEVGTLLLLLKPGEIIAGVDFRKIATNMRAILRYDELFDTFRPKGNSKEFWAKGCTPESVIAEAEAAERHEAALAARPFSATSGPNATEATVVKR